MLQALGTIRIRFLQKSQKKFHACVPLNYCNYLEVAVGDFGVIEVESRQLPCQVESKVDEDVRDLHPLLHPTGVSFPGLQPR